MYIPSKIEIPDRVCVIKGYNWDYSTINPATVTFSKKVNDVPDRTVDIIPNIITSPLQLGPLAMMSSNFYMTCDITHCLNLSFSSVGKRVVAQINHWAVNDLILSGLIEAGGKLKLGAELVVAVYGGHSSLILKGGELYSKIVK